MIGGHGAFGPVNNTRAAFNVMDKQSFLERGRMRHQRARIVQDKGPASIGCMLKTAHGGNIRKPDPSSGNLIGKEAIG